MNYEEEIKNVDSGNDLVDSSSTSSTTAAAKKDNIMERINKRNKDRQNYFDVKLEQRNKENLQYEGADYFSQSFGERVREIETRIENINESANKRTDPIELGRLFADITVEIQELQRYLTTSTIFLTDFKIKSCQTVLFDLNNSSEETRLRIMPKKKFGFSGRKIAATPTISNVRLTADKLDCSPEKSCISTTANFSVFTWTLANRKNEYIFMSADEVNGQDITISNLSNCFVELQGHAGSMQISHATDCTFLSGPIARSLFAEHCRNCTFALACQQLRLHSSAACRIHLHVTCRAIIEDCRQIEFGSYCYDYSDIDSDFQKANLDKSLNKYTDVADFNWLSPDVHSPNWKLLKDCISPDWSELRCKFKENNVDNV